MDDLLKKLDSEKNNRFKKQWSKLEKGNKLIAKEILEKAIKIQPENIKLIFTA